MQKYIVAPPEMPEELTWFKWEAYFTWISGFSLLVVMYYWGAESFMIDPSVADLASWQAIAVSLLTLGGGWVFYDLLCKSPVQKHDRLLSVIVFLFVVMVAFLLTHVLSGRASFVHVGAMIGTIMVANVFFIIIPNQKIVVADLIAGRQPDPKLGYEAKQRSTHNNYLTLPVLLMMLSQHYPMVFGHDHSWAVVALVLLLGGVIRDFFNKMHAGHTGKALYWQWPAAVVVMAVLIAFVSYRPETAADPDAPPVTTTDVFAIAQARCVTCHSANPTDSDFREPPAKVVFDSPEDLKRESARILKQSVLTNAMPLGNKTKMTKEEREAIGRWIRAGMPDDE
jgi:uncharacterized membrane protein